MTTDSPKKDTSPQRYQKVNSEKFTTFDLAAQARQELDLSQDNRARIRRRADGSFDLVAYSLIRSSAA